MVLCPLVHTVPNAGNYESLHDQCFVGDSFNQLGHNMNGFEWINEAKAHRARFGFVATKVRTRMHTHGKQW